MSWRALALPLLLVAAGCATTAPESASGGAESEASPVPAEMRGSLSPAGKALLIRGANERRAGDYTAASATLERALRIEPSAPALWLELARVRLLEGDPAQAEQLARKAQSLAATEAALERESRRLIAEALRRQ